jgi:2-oxoisovalerate dehydrogenase E1 component
LNVAAVWDLPVIFLIENNGYGLSTPTQEQYRCISLVDKAKGYGMEGIQIDGNDILSVYETVKGVRDYCIRNQKPYLIECLTFRMRGHEEASGTKYVPPKLFEIWELKDPVKNYERWLTRTGVITEMKVAEIRNEFRDKIESELAIGFESRSIAADAESELEDVYAQPSVDNQQSQSGSLIIQIPILHPGSGLCSKKNN